MELERLVRKVTTLQVRGGQGAHDYYPTGTFGRDEAVTFSYLLACSPLKVPTHPHQPKNAGTHGPSHAPVGSGKWPEGP